MGHPLLTLHLVLMAVQQRSSHSLKSMMNSDLDPSGLRVWILPVGKLLTQVAEGAQNKDRMDSRGWKQCVSTVVPGPAAALGPQLVLLIL